MDEITDNGAEQLAKFLANWSGLEHKKFVEFNREMQQDGLAPRDRCIQSTRQFARLSKMG